MLSFPKNNMPKNNKKSVDNLEAIKRLAILGLLKSGVQSKDIAMALGVDPATITRIVPSRKFKRNGKRT